MEKITHAALRVRDCSHKELGWEFAEVIVTGLRHSNCFETIYKALNYDKTKVEQGFYTDACRFIDRYDAMELALANEQLAQPTPYKELYSEDLW